MGEPYRNGRKGRMVRVARIARELDRNWRCYRGNWQPSKQDREDAKCKVASLRLALDDLEQIL